MTHRPVIDRKLAIKQAGGNPELADELLHMLLRELPHNREAIRAAYAADDWNALLASTHTLHGSAVYCALPSLAEAARALESSLKRGLTEGLDKQVDRLVEEIHRAIEVLTTESAL